MRDTPPFVELRAHTAFSFGDGAVTPEALVARARSCEYDALGLTDVADMGGVVRFALACRESEEQNVPAIHPVVGTELIVDGHPLALLARTAEGYRNIAALVTRARSGELARWTPQGTDTPHRGTPRLSWEDVAEHAADVHALTGPPSGEIGALLLAGRENEADRALARWHTLFGSRMAVEVQWHHAGRAEEALAGALIALAERRRVPWVVTNDPRYIDRAGRLVHDVLTALRSDLTLGEARARGLLRPNGGWRPVSRRTMAERWRGREEGLIESRRIAGECERLDLSWLRPPLPDFPVPAGHTADSFLEQCVREGARKRWGDVLEDKQEMQLRHELALIRALGYAGFFLVMWDGVRHAHSRNILCQGRGSAANSAVAYCLEVTAVDPVEHKLLFERFLSEVRIDGKAEPPDIDVDVEHDRREEVLDYMYGRWRRDCSAITGMVQTYRAPNAVLDAMRAFGYPQEVALRLSKRLHSSDPDKAAAWMAQEAATFGVDVTTPAGRTLLATVRAFKDLPRMRSTHPGGFVLSAAALGQYCPVEPTAMGRTVVQFDKDDLDAIGIPKFDFLGLGALSMVHRAFDLVRERKGTELSLYNLPQKDEKTFAMIAAGDTIGMFQIESRAQIASLVHTRPEHLYDLVVQVALIRPGPIQARFVKPYTRRRRGEELPVYAHDDLIPILARTQGIPIFQEQAMAISMALGGYTGAEADELRRTMGHERKLPRLLAALERLRERMLQREDISTAVADGIVQDLRSFASYGFPESHAWSFATIAYATAWLKANEPAAFYCGLLNAWPMGFYAPSTLVHDARRHGVEVYPPCLARGQATCTIEDPGDGREGAAFRIGWRHITGIGERALTALETANAARPFASVADVVRRGALTRTEAAVLAQAGAFGVWIPERRRAAWEALRIAGDTLPLAPAVQRPSRETVRTATETIGEEDGFFPRVLEGSQAVLVDYDAMGLSVSGHPMECLRPWCRRMGILDSAELTGGSDGDRVVIAGMVTVRQRPATAKGTIFLLLEDEHGVVNVIVSKKLVEKYREAVHRATFLAVHGRLERKNAGAVLLDVVAARFRSLDDRAETAAWGTLGDMLPAKELVDMAAESLGVPDPRGIVPSRDFR